MVSPLGQLAAAKASMSAWVGVLSTRATGAAWSDGTSRTVCSGQTPPSPRPTASMDPVSVSGTETWVSPVWHTIWASACAASTSGGRGGVQAASASTAAPTNEVRTMPRTLTDRRDIVLTFTSRLCSVALVRWCYLMLWTSWRALASTLPATGT